MADQEYVDSRRPPTPEENDALRQFLKWALPTFELMEVQVQGQTNLNTGTNLMLFACLAYASRRALDGEVPDHRQALNEQLDAAWEYAVRLRDFENGQGGHG